MDKHAPGAASSSQRRDRTTWILPLRWLAYRDSVGLLERARVSTLGWSGGLRTIILTGPRGEVQRWGERLLELDQRVEMGAPVGSLPAVNLVQHAA